MLAAAAYIRIVGPPELSEDVRLVTVGWETDWQHRSVDLGELVAGLPGPSVRDAIPPIGEPLFVPIAEADEWLADREPGVLLRHEGQNRFYPLQILNLHEIVNDVVGREPVVVTPLCNTASSSAAVWASKRFASAPPAFYKAIIS